MTCGKKAIATTQPSIIRDAWKSLEPDDRWQDYYVKNKDFLAAETNFWSSFGGVALAKDAQHKAPRSRR